MIRQQNADTLIVNFEDERFRQRDLELLIDVYDTYREKVKPKSTPFIFLDEIQNIPEWERFARGVHERGEAKIIVSGSSSKLLSAELATLLTGRHIMFFVQPLSFKEFLAFNEMPVELKRRQSFNPRIEIYYWKDYQQREVDFIIKEGLDVVQLIQVCHDVTNLETKEREVRSLMRAMKEFKLTEGLIITDDFEGEEEIKRFKIEYVPMWKWLLLE